MARKWTAGALERIPTLHAPIGLNAIAAAAGGVILAAQGAGKLIAVMGLVLHGEKVFHLRDDTPTDIAGIAAAAFPALTTLTLPICSEPWAILSDNKAFEVVNDDGAATSDFAGILAYKVIDEPQAT